MNIHPNEGAFVIAAGAILGISAGLLWIAQGSLVLSYPTEIQKGRFISIFWTIFNLGAVIGSAVSLAINYKSSVSVLYQILYTTPVLTSMAGKLGYSMFHPDRGPNLLTMTPRTQSATELMYVIRFLIQFRHNKISPDCILGSHSMWRYDSDDYG